MLKKSGHAGSFKDLAVYRQAGDWAGNILFTDLKMAVPDLNSGLSQRACALVKKKWIT